LIGVFDELNYVTRYVTNLMNLLNTQHKAAGVYKVTSIGLPLGLKNISAEHSLFQIQPEVR